MESMENSPIWLALVQILVVIGNAYLLARQKNRSEVEKRDVEGFRIDLGLVRQLAEAAKQDAHDLNVQKYEAIRAKCDEVLLELKDCRLSNQVLRETVTSLSNKLASREKVEKRNASKAEEPEPPEEEVQLPPVPGGMTAAQLAQLGGIPLQAPSPAAPAASARMADFGKVAR